jgi:UDP-N-acetylglucosamine 4,6-dehydratase
MLLSGALPLVVLQGTIPNELHPNVLPAWEGESPMFSGKTLLVTGGTGTFGNAVVRRLLSTEVAEIRVFSRDEKKQFDMRLEYSDPKLKFYIGDVREPASLRDAMVGVDFVFNAAALKQVPSCEFYPREALLTNALGTEHVMNAALSAGVDRLTVLSTDKAAYPINAMGISKAMMEKLAIAKSRVATANGLVICVTRYGNVMASRGSVIPLFVDQIKQGKPLTITDPDMTRFMMTIEDAVDLVFYSFRKGQPGDLFVQKAPAATIETLALALKKLYNAESPIRLIGTRHGEKQHETLLTREEMARSEDLGDYFRVPADNRDLNYDMYFVEGALQPVEDFNSHNTHRLDVDGMAELLLKLDFIRKDLDLSPLPLGDAA